MKNKDKELEQQMLKIQDVLAGLSFNKYEFEITAHGNSDYPFSSVIEKKDMSERFIDNLKETLNKEVRDIIAERQKLRDEADEKTKRKNKLISDFENYLNEDGNEYFGLELPASDVEFLKELLKKSDTK